MNGGEAEAPKSTPSLHSQTWWLVGPSSSFNLFHFSQPSSSAHQRHLQRLLPVQASHNYPPHHSTITMPTNSFFTTHSHTTSLTESIAHLEEAEAEAEAQDELALTTHSLPSCPPSLFIPQFLPSPSSSSSSSPISYPQSSNTSPNTRAATTKTNLQTVLERFLSLMHIIDEQELAKHVLGLGIPMGVGLVFSVKHLATSSEMQGVGVALCCAFAAIWNGILLRNTFQAASILILVAGIGFMVSAFFAFVGCFLSSSLLRWISALCLLATLFPLATFVTAFLRRGMKLPLPSSLPLIHDPENGLIS